MTQDNTKAGWKKWSLPVRVGIAAAACWLIAKDLDWLKLKIHLFDKQLWMLLVVAILVFATSQCLVGFRWWLFLRAQQIAVSLRLAIKLNFLGLFFSNFLPSSVGGDLVRAWYVSRYSSRKMQAAMGVLVDRTMGLIATLLIGFTAILLFMRDADMLTFRRIDAETSFKKTLYVPHLILAIVIGIGVMLLLQKPLKSITHRAFRHLVQLLSQLRQVVGVYYRHPFVLALGLFLTIFLQSMVITAYWLIGRNLNIEAPLGYYFIFFPLVWVIGSIPVSIAGLGILEGGLVFLFDRYGGAPDGSAAALALCQRLTWVAASLPGLVVHLTGSHRHAGDSK